MKYSDSMIIWLYLKEFLQCELFLRYLIIILISVQHAQKRSCNRNSLRSTMRGKKDSLACLRNTARGQRSSLLGSLGDNSTCVQGFKVHFSFFHDIYHIKCFPTFFKTFFVILFVISFLSIWEKFKKLINFLLPLNITVFESIIKKIILIYVI